MIYSFEIPHSALYLVGDVSETNESFDPSASAGGLEVEIEVTDFRIYMGDSHVNVAPFLKGIDADYYEALREHFLVRARIKIEQLKENG